MKNFLILAEYIKPLKGQLVVLLFFFLVTSLISIPIPIIQKHIIDDLIPSKSNEQLVLAVLSVMVLMIINTGFGYLKSKSNIKFCQRIITRIRSDVYEKLQQMDLPFLKNNQSGSLLSRVLNDVGLIRNLITTQFLSCFVSVIKIIIIAVILFRMNVILSLLSLSIIPGVVFIFLRYKSKIYTKSKKLQESYAAASGKIRENIAAISIIQTENAEIYKGKETRQYCKNLENISVDRGIAHTKGNIIISLLSSAPLFGIIWGVGGYMVINGFFTIGSIIAYYQYIFLIIGPISTFFKFGMNIQSGLAAIERVSEILNSKSLVHEKKDAKPLTASISGLRFQNVGLHFPAPDGNKGKITILKNINIEINQGETIAIAGANGSGKTTIAQLLLRQCNFTQGTIFLNGEDIRNYKIKDIRERMAYVSQEQFFFNDTIRNNLTLGREIPDHDIHNALRITNTLKFVNSLKNGLNSIIGEQGFTLSGGEKQLLSLTRAFIRRPDIYIFDEPFSSIDLLSEQIIQHSIEPMIADTTTIIISHKQSLIKLADRVVVLSNGSTVKSGTPDE